MNNDKYFQSWWKKVDRLTPDEKTTLASAMFGSLEAYNFPQESFERLLRQAKAAKFRDDK